MLSYARMGCPHTGQWDAGWDSDSPRGSATTTLRKDPMKAQESGQENHGCSLCDRRAGGSRLWISVLRAEFTGHLRSPRRIRPLREIRRGGELQA